ncbi:XRE family transcriptional regulator [Streptomyces pseudogriseolus]|uniref:XRE family transcriptional regulator n=1 Tax=Streptomyces pseudogriseolus TaxID=36817 RepID=UPI003FA2DA63
MAENRNGDLAGWMAELGLTAGELADLVNREIEQFTGRVGETSERTVFRWLSGEVGWPQARQRVALERASGRPVADLGFKPRGKSMRARRSSEEDPEVRRREFVGAAAGAAAAVSIPVGSSAAAAPRRVGTSDVIRLRDAAERLVELDAVQGGTGLERASVRGAEQALLLQRGAASQRVRTRLFSLAANFTCRAGWALIDAGRLDGAGRHLERALMLAGMARDADMEMQVWNLRSMLARQRGDYVEAVAAAQAAQATGVVRRSPVHASLGYARLAVSQAHGGDVRGALRSIGRAEEVLGKADLSEPVSAWIEFYGPAELFALTAVVQDEAGRPAQAEAASYRSLAALPSVYRRNRANTTARLALAQLHQGEVEQAYVTSSLVFQAMAGVPLPGRTRQLLGDFQRELIARAPAVADGWMEQYRTEWSRS